MRRLLYAVLCIGAIAGMTWTNAHGLVPFAANDATTKHSYTPTAGFFHK